MDININQIIKDIFLYSSDKPLLFTQFYFWGFFAVVFTIYSFIYKKKALRNAYLFFASLFFYYKTSGFFFFILLFSTFTDFFIAKGIYKSKSSLNRKLLLALSVTINLTVLFYFKYTEFFTSTINNLFGTNFHIINYFSLAANNVLGTHFTVDRILLPVGISFFTFQTISYSVDVYQKKIKPVNSILDFGFYVSFFPQLVAGPIVRAADFIPQLYQDYRLSKQEFGLAVFWILKGLIKKMFISDYISINFVDRVFETPLNYTGFENLMALYGYSLQVYADFSGYTDIAIGVALLMGFRLPTNFNSPYKAKSTGEFWKRWHISLSSWLKDYLYIPLGGNRRGSAATYISLTVILIVIVLLSGWIWLSVIFMAIVAVFWILARIFPQVKKTITTNINLMITMLLGGLWHGSSWMFVIWGGLNGIGLVVYKFWKRQTQIARWIILVLLNSLTFLAYKTGIWHSNEGIIVWISLNVVWFISYAIWYIKNKDNKPAKYLQYIISAIFLTIAGIVITYISGIKQISFAGGYSWIAISLLPVAIYFTIRKYLNNTLLYLLSANFAIAFIVFVFYKSTTTILIWFIISSIALAVYFFGKVKKSIDRNYLVYFWGIFLTFNFITFTRIWFRGQNMQITYQILDKIGHDWNLSLIPQMIASYKYIFATMFIGYFVHWISADYKEKYTNWFIRTPIWVKILISIAVVFFLYQVKSSDLQPFIYFQF